MEAGIEGFLTCCIEEHISLNDFCLPNAIMLVLCLSTVLVPASLICRHIKKGLPMSQCAILKFFLKRLNLYFPSN